MRRSLIARVSYIGFLAFGTAVVAYSAWRYYRVPRVAALDERATTVEGISLADAGAFAAPQFAPHREMYARNLSVYRSLPMTAASTEPAAIVSPLTTFLAAELAKDSRDARVVESLPPQAIDLLSARLAVVLARAAGLPVDAYEQLVGPDEALCLPENLPEPEHALLASLLGAAVTRPVSDGENEATLRRAFEDRYRRAAAAVDDPHRVVAWSLDARGAKVAMGRVSSKDNNENVLFARLVGRDRDLFRGLLARSSYSFHRSPASWNEFSDAHASVVRFEMSLVIRDGSDDFYPMWLCLYFDPDAARWQLTNAYRTVSPRAANLDALAY